MPFEILPETEGNVVALRIWGKLSAEDYQSFGLEFSKIVAQVNRVRLLIYSQGFEGSADSQAESGRFTTRIMFRHNVERVAVVTDRRSTSETARFTDIMANTEVRHFAPTDRDAAWAWLAES